MPHSIMKKILIFILPLILLFSCSEEKEEIKEVWYTLSNQNLMQEYEVPDRSLNLSNKNIKWFVSFSQYLTWTEVNNIYLQNNSIELLDVSKYSKLWRLDLSNNLIRFWTDVKLPSGIRHLNLSNNSLSSIKWLSNLKKLKTVDISNNDLDDNDIKSLIWLDNLQYINIEWNKVSDNLRVEFWKFNARYLSTHKMPYVK